MEPGQATPPRWTADLLRREIGLATGCTEPAAIALCARAAAHALGTPPERVIAQADVGTHKNALAVGLPGTKLRGPAAAAALGACATGAPATLDVLGAASAAHREQARALVAADAATAEPLAERGLRIEVSVMAGRRTATATVAERHDRVVAISVDDSPQSTPGPSVAVAPDDGAVIERLGDAAAIVAAAESLRHEGLTVVDAALRHNLHLAEDLREEQRNCPVRLVTAIVNRRMKGRSMAVATAGGSGNSGLTVSLGYWAATAAARHSRDRRLRGLALAHLANLAIKARIGRVGPLCGGVSASATAVGCGIAWLEGRGVAGVDRVMTTMVDAHAGTLCDGANATCAIKIGVALRTAIEIARSGEDGDGGDGLGGSDTAQALRRLGGIAAATGPTLDKRLLALLTAGPD